MWRKRENLICAAVALNRATIIIMPIKNLAYCTAHKVLLAAPRGVCEAFIFLVLRFSIYCWSCCEPQFFLHLHNKTNNKKNENICGKNGMHGIPIAKRCC